MQILLGEVSPKLDRNQKKLLKMLGRIRKRAGKVRDLDVQLAALRALKMPREPRRKTQLVNRLIELRSQQEKKLQKAVDKVGSATDGRAVVAAMKAMPTDDPLFGKGHIRSDGRKIHPMYLLEVKKPDESKDKWDLLKVVSTIRGEDAFRPESEGNCKLVAK